MIITFFITLALVLIMFGLKLYEIKKGVELPITAMMKSLDEPIQGFLNHVKHEVSFLTWNNLALLVRHIYRSIQECVVSYKKRLDSRQPRFLVAITPNALAHKNRKSPSNFLKVIGEHKGR